jgi:hypothetical protein
LDVKRDFSDAGLEVHSVPSRVISEGDGALEKSRRAISNPDLSKDWSRRKRRKKTNSLRPGIDGLLLWNVVSSLGRKLGVAEDSFDGDDVGLDLARTSHDPVQGAGNALRIKMDREHQLRLCRDSRMKGKERTIAYDSIKPTRPASMFSALEVVRAKTETRAADSMMREPA